MNDQLRAKLGFTLYLSEGDPCPMNDGGVMKLRQLQAGEHVLECRKNPREHYCRASRDAAYQIVHFS